MKIKNIGSNMTEVDFGNGVSVLISYSTPVAAWAGHHRVRTDKFFSVTTSRHINKWFDCDSQNPVGWEIPQELIERLYNSHGRQYRDEWSTQQPWNWNGGGMQA